MPRRRQAPAQRDERLHVAARAAHQDDDVELGDGQGAARAAVAAFRAGLAAVAFHAPGLAADAAAAAAAACQGQGRVALVAAAGRMLELVQSQLLADAGPQRLHQLLALLQQPRPALWQVPRCGCRRVAVAVGAAAAAVAAAAGAAAAARPKVQAEQAPAVVRLQLHWQLQHLRRLVIIIQGGLQQRLRRCSHVAWSRGSLRSGGGGGALLGGALGPSAGSLASQQLATNQVSGQHGAAAAAGRRLRVRAVRVGRWHCRLWTSATG